MRCKSIRLPKAVTWIAAFGAILSIAPKVHAVNCTLYGTITVGSLDTYYCDGDFLDCSSGWNEVDLDEDAQPLKHIRVTVTHTGTNSPAVTKTNGSGEYSVTWSQTGACTAEYITRRVYFERVHETDTSKVRFQITGHGTDVVTSDATQQFKPGSASHLHDVTFPRDPNYLPGRAANIYYTMNSAVEEMSDWHSRIETLFKKTPTSDDVLRIRYSSTAAPPNGVTGGLYDAAENDVIIGVQSYRLGFILRHELGHAAHSALHNHLQMPWRPCYSEKLGLVDGHGAWSCEWGWTAMIEGIAHFFGVRSITTGGEAHAWACEHNMQGNCSAEAASTPDSDGVSSLGGTYWFAGLSDHYADSRDDCVRTMTNQCGFCGWPNGNFTCATCTDGNGNGLCDNYQSMGFRNEFNVARFLWDLVDADDADEGDNLNVSSLAGYIAGMPCAESGGWSYDGNCNEPDEETAANCDPYYESALEFGAINTLEFGGLTTGTRDSYNPYDYGDMIPQNQYDARYVNCVELAED